MPPQIKEILPFPTRKDLNFEHGVTLSLRVRLISTAGLTLSLRGMTKEGVFNFRFIVVSSTAFQTFTFTVPDIPIFFSILHNTSGGVQGSIYATVELMANNDPLHQLVAGQIYGFKGISWPVNSAENMAPNRGEMVQINSGDPVAGAEQSLAGPDGTRWLIRFITFTLVTDATVANRRPHLVFNTDNTPSLNVFSSVDQTASLTRNYTAAHFGGALSESNDNDILIPLPDNIWIEINDTITTETTGIVAGDNYGQMRVHVERFAAP